MNECHSTYTTGYSLHRPITAALTAMWYTTFRSGRLDSAPSPIQHPSDAWESLSLHLSLRLIISAVRIYLGQPDVVMQGMRQPGWGQTVVVRLELQKLSWYLFVNCSDIQEGWAESCFHSYMPLCNEVVVHCQNPLIHTEEPDHCCPSEGSQTGDCLTIKMHRMTSDEGTEGFIPISFLPLSFHWTYQCFSFISE